ncbi:MAG: hypothetical protein CME15_04165 [Gemmatimonadetes bacterium]|nr:hypothetical protein [Gemmatimonadota bacterium]
MSDPDAQIQSQETLPLPSELELEQALSESVPIVRQLPSKDLIRTHTILCGFLISVQDLVHGRECVPSELVNHSQL